MHMQKKSLILFFPTCSCPENITTNSDKVESSPQRASVKRKGFNRTFTPPQQQTTSLQITEVLTLKLKKIGLGSLSLNG